MYCEPCRVERLGTARFCVLCGTKLIERPRAEVEADLARVRWLIDELVEWDKMSVPARARDYVLDRYRKREKVLLSALMHQGSPGEVEAPRPAPVADPIPPPSFAEPEPVVAAPAPEPTPPAPPPPRFERPVTAALLEVRPDAPTVEDQVVEEASTWSRIWKPFLNESIGWFIGAFLIVAGTFYGVSSAWEGMSSTARALLVFGLAGAWTLGFSAWAQFLWRREATRGAARVLRLIGMAMAPLAPFAVGPVVNQSPVVAGVLVLAWSVIAAALAMGVTRDVQHVGLRWVPASMAVCAAMMGLGPWVVPLKGAAVWLAAIPVGLLWLNARSGAGTQGTQAKRFAFLAPLYLAVLFAARLHFAMGPGAVSLATWAPFLALALTAALELRAPVGADGRPRWESAADSVSVLVAAGQLGLMAWALLGAAPAFFLTSAVGAHTAWRMLKGSTSPLAPRWIYPLYFFSYFAFQTCGQLVPGPLTRLLQQLKEGLGYAPSGTLPFAYNAVYAALFVIAGAVLAVRWTKAREGWAEPLFRCTWVTASLTVALAVSSLPSDTRPAMISAPLLLALSLWLGPGMDRPAFSRVAAGTALAWALTLAVWANPLHSALPVAGVALLLALAAVPFTAPHREPLSLAGYALVAVAVALAWVVPGTESQVVALGVAFLAAWLIGRNTNIEAAQEAAWLIPAIAVARGVVLWRPEYAPLALAGAALGLALLARSPGRLRFAEAASALAAVVAPVWQVVLQEQRSHDVPLLGTVCVVAALALAFGARRSGPAPTAAWRDAVALCLGATALLPFEMWPGWGARAAAVAYAAAGLGASVWAAAFGRRWRPALLGTLVLLGAVTTAGFAEDRHQSQAWVALVLALGTFATLRALLPSISVPIAGLFALRATDGDPTGLLGVAALLSVVALFEEWDLTWNHVLGKSRVAWAGSLSALLTLAGIACVCGLSNGFHADFTQRHWLLAAGLPLLWLRATRSGVLGFALAPLALAAAAAAEPSFEHTLQAPMAAWVACGAVFLLTHLVAAVPPIRKLLFGGVKAELGAWALGGAALTGLPLVADGGSGLPWALLLAFAASEQLGARLVVASLFAAATPELPPVFATALMALALAEKVGSGLVSRVLGAQKSAATLPAMAVSAIGLALFASVTGPVAELAPMAWLVAAAFAVSALVLEQPWLFAAAVAAAALPVRIDERPELLGRAAWLAVGAAGLAAVLRFEAVQGVLKSGLRRVNLAPVADLASPFWLGASAVVAVVMAMAGRHPALAVPLLAAGALLLFTPKVWEVGSAAALSAVVVAVVVGVPEGAAVLGGAGFVLCLAGMLLETKHPSALAWHHAGWAMSLLALAGGTSLHHPATALAWCFAAGCAVVVAQRKPALEWARWAGLAAALHVGLFYLGLKLSTGAPRELILPWVATASLVLAAVALKLGKGGRAAQRFGAAYVLLALGLCELSGGLVLLDAIHVREAAVAAVGVAVALWALAGRIADDDDPVSAWFAGVAVAVGFVALRRLAFGAGPDAVETIAALVAGAGVGGLARYLSDHAMGRSAAVARGFAFWWPLAGHFAAPWNTPWTLCLLLLAQSAHFAVLARGEAMRRRAASLSTLAFNGAMLAAFLGAGAHSAEYLLIPFGLSLLMLLKAFEGDLAEGTRVKLRAAAVTLVYGAAAFRPLTFDTTGALWLCVALCVVGVGLGIVLKVRSYVYLGTAFMVTTVVANLVRYGVREPKMGALFLSGLGLAVVGFMVLVTTKRSELSARYQRARDLLQNWEG